MKPYLLLAALLPAVFLLVRVYRLDKIEKEPFFLLALLVLLGALSGFAAVFLETALLRLTRMLWFEESIGFTVMENFIAVGLCEEICKLAPVKLVAYKNPAFNYRFDAVVYCTASALGFAALENVLYVAKYGLSVAVSRAVLSVPGHFFFAVFMGFFLGEQKAAQVYCNRARQKHMRVLTWLVPTLLHGFWDFCLGFDSLMMNAIFLLFVLIFFLFADRLLKTAAARDREL